MNLSCLVDLIASKHGNCPRTHTQSKNQPIDCIFGSASLSIAQGGFLFFKKLLSEHRGIWIDIPKHLLFGYNPPQHTCRSARRLKLQDPRIVARYIDTLHQYLLEYDLYARMDNIHRRACIFSN